MSVKRLDYDNFTKTDVHTGRTTRMTRDDLISRIYRLEFELSGEKVLTRHLIILVSVALVSWFLLVIGVFGHEH